MPKALDFDKSSAIKLYPKLVIYTDTSRWPFC